MYSYSNNEYARALREHGCGTYKECFRKGYAQGYNQKITDLNGFIAHWTGAYKPHVVQHLLYGDGALPRGYQRATLSQAMQRGFALGSIARAKAEQKKLRKNEEKAAQRTKSSGMTNAR